MKLKGEKLAKLAILKEATIRAKGARAFIAQPYSQAHPRAKLHPSCQEGGMLEEEFEGNRGIEGPQSKGLVTTSACL